jgi:hypothetical protein
MRRITMIGVLGATAMIATGCGGSTTTFKNAPRPPAPINITGSVNDSRVLISPSSFGAGPINLYVTNAASRSVTLTVRSPSGVSVARLPWINPDTPGEVKFNPGPGVYQVIATPSGIRPAELHVGGERPNAANSLLQP